MTRALTTIAAIAALAVTAAPVASAATSKKPPPRGFIGAGEVFELNIATKRPKAPAAMRLTAITDGTSNTLQFVTATPQPGGSNGIIAILIGL